MTAAVNEWIVGAVAALKNAFYFGIISPIRQEDRKGVFVGVLVRDHKGRFKKEFKDKYDELLIIGPSGS